MFTWRIFPFAEIRSVAAAAVLKAISLILKNWEQSDEAPMAIPTQNTCEKDYVWTNPYTPANSLLA